jgi:hypothetical protein
MSILADVEIVLKVAQEVDSFLGTITLSPELAALKAKLEQALSVVSPLLAIL